MPPSGIRSIDILGLHGQHKLSVTFGDRLNIVHGKNGSGKTTLLHVLANLLEKDIERFCHITFNQITIRTADDHEISLRQQSTPELRSVSVFVDGGAIATIPANTPTPPAVALIMEERLGGRPVYLPAFRTMLEGSTAGWQPSHHFVQSEETRKEFEQLRRREATLRRTRPRPQFFFGDFSESVATKTIMCRQWFGPFVPVVRYPSLWDLAHELAQELHSALFQLSAFDQTALSSVFVNVLQAALITHAESAQGTLDEAANALRDSLRNLKDAYASAPEAYVKIAEFIEAPINTPRTNENLIKSILRVYADAVQDRVKAQNQAFQTIKTFEDSVNRFLSQKQLNLVGATPGPRTADALILLDDGRLHPLNVLSSGERHVLTLLFCATHMTESDGSVLIDEPELSLHIDWQRIILNELVKQAGNRQIIACTHATEVAADHRESLVQLKFEKWTEQPVLFDTGSDSDIQEPPNGG